MSKFFTTAFLATAITAGALAFLSAPASAGWNNGLSANGINPNGLSANGLTANGLSNNAVNPNALTSNALNQNGLESTNTVSIQGLPAGATATIRFSFGGGQGAQVTDIELPR